MSTSFGVRSTLRSAAARRIEAAGLAFQRQEEAARSAEPVRPAVAATMIRTRAPGQCHRIVAEVAAKYGVTSGDVLSDRRARVLIPTRHEAMFRCVSETSLSLPAIARIFGRDHTSIGHAVMRHHIRTGDPLPRGMDWKAGKRKRR